MGNPKPNFEPLQERTKLPDLAKEYYNEVSYQNMIIALGQTLIANHELEKFNSFFFSQNSLFMSDDIVTDLLGCAFQHLVPEFTVPIYALCNSKFAFKRPAKHFMTCESKMKVTEHQL